VSKESLGGENPYIEDFEQSIRAGDQQDEQYYHPWLSYREELANTILDNKPEIPAYVPDRFFPHTADKGTVLTPFDKFSEETRVVIPDSMYIEGCMRQREFYLQLANHPARMWAMQQLESVGFQPPQSLPEGVIDIELVAGRVVQLSDLGQGDGIRSTQEKTERINSLISDMQLLRNASQQQIDISEELKSAEDRVNGLIENIPLQVHRTELLANGPFTLIRGKAFSFIGGGANPDIFGTVLSGETAAKMGVMFGVPEVGEFSDIKRQVALASAVMERLTVEDSLLEGRSDEEKEYTVSHWKAAVTGVLEGTPDKALKRAKALAEVGVTTFRIYQHTPGREVIHAVKVLRKEFPDAIIIASQIADEETALLCQYEGADAIISGMGSGGRCTTALQAQSIPTNAPLSWNLRGKLDIPMIGEGGVIDNSVVAMLTGFSMANGCGTFGGTIETGGIYAFTDDAQDTSKIWYPYDGEASPSMKLRTETAKSKRTLRTGDPFSPEGGESQKYLRRLEESMTKKIFDSWIRVNMGLVVLGVEEGPFSIQKAQSLSPSPLVLNTLAGVAAQDLH
jgi:hypothetical protein